MGGGKGVDPAVREFWGVVGVGEGGSPGRTGLGRRWGWGWGVSRPRRRRVTCYLLANRPDP